MNSFTKSFTISSYDLDPSGKGRLTALGNYFQEIAYHHANQLGFGYADLKQKNTFWVLSRLRIHIVRYPDWNESVEIETWPSGIQKLFARRDFRVTDNKKMCLALASSAWLIVDASTNRPVRFSDDFYQWPIKPVTVFHADLEKINIPVKMEQKHLQSVRYSDLDVVGHVNNVKYIEWCLDLIPAEDLIRKPVKEFEINYLHESRPGEEVLLSEAANQNGELFIQGMNTSREVEVFRAKLSQ